MMNLDQAVSVYQASIDFAKTLGPALRQENSFLPEEISCYNCVLGTIETFSIAWSIYAEKTIIEPAQAAERAAEPEPEEANGEEDPPVG